MNGEARLNKLQKENLMENETPIYDLDNDTRTLLITVLELAFLTSNLQIDVKDSQTVADICFQTAARFGIELELREFDSLSGDKPATSPTLDIDNLPFPISVTDKGSK
jgi:hypothetical protein